MKRIGWVGTGIMGRSMCAHLIDAGYEATVFNRTMSKAKDLVDKGAAAASNPREVTEASDYVFTIVGFPHDVEEVYFGNNGIVDALKPGMIVIDMTTSEPTLATRIAEAAAEKGARALDAPVSGGDVGAREGKLAIMAGGDQESYGQIKPLFDHMGENIALMGPAGAGQHTKMSNQILIASTMIGVVESLLYAYKAGLDMEGVIDVIGKGAASSWSINNLGRRIAKGNFDPGFFIMHFIKDMGIALAEARRMNIALPGLALAHQFYVSAQGIGWEKLGTQGLYRVFARMNGLESA